MKNFKKVVALVLALSLVLSTGITAFAATENATEGHVLYQLGLMKGTSTTEEVLALDDEANAYMAMTLIGRALGWESEATEVAFTDVPDYAAPYVAYAVEMKITNGVDATTFGSYVDGARTVTWILRALGYDMTEAYTMTDELAATAGIVVPTATPVLRDTVAGVIYDTLSATPVDGDMTVIETLIAANPSIKDAAVAAGLVAATPEALELDSVMAKNLVQLEVVFNQAVTKKSAEKMANYTVKKGTTTLKVGEITVAEDLKSVVLNLDDNTTNLGLGKASNLAQQDKVNVTVDKVVTEAGVVLAKTEIKDVEALDMTIPTVTGMEIVGKKTIKVMFSEPMEPSIDGGATSAAQLDKAAFKINDGKLYVNKVELQNNNTEALVYLYSDLKEGDVTVEVNNKVADFAGFGVVKTVESLTVVKDTDAPTIVGFEKATPTSVTLIWNEDITILKTGITNYYHTNSSNDIENALTNAELDGNKLKLTFEESSKLPNGTAYVYVLKEAVADLWGNKNVQQMTAVAVEVDVTAPTVVGDVDVTAEDKFTIEFSEDLKATTAEKEANYKILDKDSKEIDVLSSAVYTASTASDNAKVVFTLDKKVSGMHAIVIKDVEDAVGNDIVETTLSFDVDDKTAPEAGDFTATAYKLSSTDQNDQMIKVSFGEAMATEGKYSIGDLDKYTVDGKVLANIKADIVVTVVDDGKAVEIDIPSNTEDTDSFDITTPVVVKVARVADAAGNFTVAIENSINLVAESTVAIEKMEATDTKTIVVTFSDEFAAFDGEDIVFQESNDSAVDKIKVSAVETTTNSKGKTVATFTLTDEDAFVFMDHVAMIDGHSIQAEVVAAGDVDSVNRYGEKLKSGLASVTVADKIAPALINGDIAEDSITDKVDRVLADQGVVKLYFEEAIDQLTVSILSFEVKDATVKTVAFEDGDKTVVLNLASKDKPLLDTKVTQKATIKDVAGNGVSDISTEVAFYADTKDTTATLTAPVAGAQTKVVVKFDEKLHADTLAITDISGLLSAASNDVAGTPAAIAVTSVSNSVVWSVDDGKSVATITIPSTTFVTGQTVRLNFVDNVVKDVAGNDVASTINVDATVVAP